MTATIKANGAESRSCPRLLLVTGYPPTTVIGGGIILRKLLDDFTNDRLKIISNANVIEALRGRGDHGQLLAVPHFGVGAFGIKVPGIRRVGRALNVLKIVTVARLALKQLVPGSSILAVPWGGELGSELFVGAYIAHVISGAPLVVYEMDEWRYSTRRAGISAIALERVFHGRILRAARSVWTISEAMADLMWERYQIKARVLPNLVVAETVTAVGNGSRVSLDEFQLVFTGAVYGAQAGAIRNVLNAIRSSFKNVSLCIYTHQSAENLACEGIVGRSVTIKPAVAPENLSSVFAQADALLLPLSFDEEQRGIVMTSLPTKTADYLISGVPILVYAPAYSSVVREAKQGQWAAVVEDASVELLNQALDRLATDIAWRRQLVLNALQTAKRKHDLKRRRAEFIRAIADTSATVHSNNAGLV